jgi:hypothetical protein
MNLQAVRILFLKDLFLSRRHLFTYFMAGLASSALVCVPEPSVSFVGFLLVVTVAIASGIHFIGTLLLSETTDQTRLFVMSMPISLLDYSIGKIAVMLTTYLIPWAAMFGCMVVATFVAGKHGNIIVLPAIFFFLLCGFTLQLVTAVVSESVGWTISVMVACNVCLNVFLMKLFNHPQVSEIVKGDMISWPNFVVQILLVEGMIVASALILAFLFQIRKRDLV